MKKVKRAFGYIVSVISLIVVILTGIADAGGVHFGMTVDPYGGVTIGIGSRSSGIGHGWNQGYQGYGPGMYAPAYALNYAPVIVMQPPPIPTYIGRGNGPAEFRGGAYFPQGVNLPNGAYVYRIAMGQMVRVYYNPGTYPPGARF